MPEAPAPVYERALGSSTLRRCIRAGDYRQPGWPDQVKQLTDGKGVDVALEMIGPTHLSTTLTALAPFGRLIEYGAVARYSGHVDGAVVAAMLYAEGHNQSLINFNVSDYFVSKPVVAVAVMGRLLGWMADGIVTGPSIHTMPLSEAARFESHYRPSLRRGPASVRLTCQACSQGAILGRLPQIRRIRRRLRQKSTTAAACT